MSAAAPVSTAAEETGRIKASIVITAYQAKETIGRAIRSVLDTPRRSEIEVIVVDDASTDGTAEIVSDLCRKYPNLRLITMPGNSGSPSTPRNHGIAAAKGIYVSTLDDDDYYDMDSYFQLLDVAFRDDLDFAKGYLIVHEGCRTYAANRLEQAARLGRDTIEKIVASQSLTADYLVRRRILVDFGLGYDPALRIGEDTAFITDILSHCEKAAYVDLAYLHYVKVPAALDNLSSTQRWGDRELRSQMEAWRRAETNLRRIGMSYTELRLPAGFRNMLLALVRYSDGISEKCFRELCGFARETESRIRKKMLLAGRFQELYDSILSGDYRAFCTVQRRRLLIAGFDLKFITPFIPLLAQDYEVKVDEWAGHNAHDEAKSKKLLKWADIIWCEWLLGNAVYYAENKASYQKLVIRAHRFELTREFGLHVDYGKVDAVFAVSYYFMELFRSTFRIPREKMRLLSNYVETEIYRESCAESSVFDLGIVGILPARKGYLRALKLLERLRREDSRFVLHVCGNMPEEVDWIRSDPAEWAYFEECDAFIRDHGLSEAVIREGYKPREHLYDRIGAVLSLSDGEGIPESFHLAPAEGACAGALGLILRWPGVEYIYPEDAVYDSIEDMAGTLLLLSRQPEEYDRRREALAGYIRANYDIRIFQETVRQYLNWVRLMS